MRLGPGQRLIPVCLCDSLRLDLALYEQAIELRIKQHQSVAQEELPPCHVPQIKPGSQKPAWADRGYGWLEA